jgi:hypothetical protein
MAMAAILNMFNPPKPAKFKNEKISMEMDMYKK